MTKNISRNLAHTNWDNVASQQFQGLDADIQDDWGDLYQLTSGRVS